jgi:transcriptional regulator with XRE-family HTH domain
MPLPTRLRQKRVELGWSQKELAGRLGVTQGAVAQLESGRRSPSRALVSRLARVLGVSADYLLSGEESALLDISQLNAGDRELVRRFCDFLRWEKRR